MSFVKTCPDGELWEGEMKAFMVREKQILLIRSGGSVNAFENRCAHLGARLSAGTLKGSMLTCPIHHWEYDARTGRGINPDTVALKRFATKTEDGYIWVDAGDEARAADPDVDAERVGPVLDHSAEAEFVVEAIRAENRDVEVIDRGSYLRVAAPRSLRLSRDAVERLSGGSFVFPGDLEKIMPSFSGKLSFDEKGALWESWKKARD